MKPRVLITGATGFVGRQVVRSLAQSNVLLRLIVREGRQFEALSHVQAAAVIATPDVFSESVEWWQRQCADIDLVIHMAWYAEPGKYLDSPKNIDCLIGSLNLAKGAMLAGVKRFVGVGTCFEYDLNAGVLSVDTPIKPITPYAAAKAALYLSLSELLPKSSVEFAWCRLFYLFGEGEDPRRLVPYLRSRLEKGEPAELTSGKQIRDFLDVSEAGRRLANVALGHQSGAINVCSGTPVTVRQLAERIADEHGRRDLLHFDARPDNLVDPPCVLGISNSEHESVI